MTYSTSQAQAGRGSSLAIGSTPVPIGEITDVPFKRPEWQFVEATNFESGNDEEVLTSIRKTAQFAVTFNRVSSDAGQAAVEAAYQNGTLQPFVMQLPKTVAQTTNGDKYTFNAYIIGSDFGVKPTDKIAGTMNLKTSGPVTLTLGT
jgi:hypothetical protein